MDSPKVALVRTGFKCFEEQDESRLFSLFHDDAEVTDPINNTIAVGKEAMAQVWQRALAAEHSFVLGDILEIGDSVVVAAHHEFYDREKGRLGPGVAEVYRFVFRGDRIAKLEVETLERIPDDARGLLS